MTRACIGLLLSVSAAVGQIPLGGITSSGSGGGGGITVIDGTSGRSTIGTVSGAHTLNIQTGDQIWVFLNWALASNCSPTITVTVGVDTASIIGTTVENVASGLNCVAQYHVASASTNNSSATVTSVISAAGAFNVLNAIQMRHTSNAAPSQTATCDGVTTGNNCNGSSTVFNTSSSVTTTHANSIVVTGVGFGGAASGLGVGPQTNGCFGVTGTTPANVPESSVYEYSIYRVLSATVGPGVCNMSDTSVALNKAVLLSVFY